MKKERGRSDRRPNSDDRPQRPRAWRRQEDSQRPFQGREETQQAEQRSENSSQRESKENNVQLYLSPRMLELAREMAYESRMPMRTYLTEALKYVLLAHGKRLGKSDKFVTEFKSERNKTVATWKADSEKNDRFPGADRKEDEPRRRFNRNNREERRSDGRSSSGNRFSSGQDRYQDRDNKKFRDRPRSSETAGAESAQPEFRREKRFDKRQDRFRRNSDSSSNRSRSNKEGFSGKSFSGKRDRHKGHK